MGNPTAPVTAARRAWLAAALVLASAAPFARAAPEDAPPRPAPPSATPPSATTRSATTQSATVALKPPRGFQLAERFQGYRHPPSGSVIKVTHVPMSAGRVETTLTVGWLGKRGAAQLSRETAQLPGAQRGVLFELDREINGAKFREWMLLVGDGNQSSLVTATFPASHASVLSRPLKAALLTTRFTPGAARRPPTRRPTPQGAQRRAPPKTGSAPAPGEAGASPTKPTTGPTPPGPATGVAPPPKPEGNLPAPSQRTGAMPGSLHSRSAASEDLISSLEFSVAASSLLPYESALGRGYTAAARREGDDDARWADARFTVRPGTRRTSASLTRGQFVDRLAGQAGAFTKCEVEKRTELAVDGLTGVAATARATFESGQGAAVVYQAVLFDGDDYYSLTGRCGAKDRETHLAEFERLTRSFRRTPDPGATPK